MRIHATINERTVRRTFRGQKIGRTGLPLIDKDLPAFALKASKNGARTLIVRVVHKLGGRDTVVLGTADEVSAAEAREKAFAIIASARAGVRPDPCSPISCRVSCTATDVAGSHRRARATLA